MKKLLTKCISIMAAACISMTMLCTTAFAADTPSAWAQASVDTAVSWGLLPDGMQERYQDNITREEFAEVLEKICNHYSGGKDNYRFWDNYESVDDDPFTDTDNWSVKQMYCAGIMSGIGDGKFGPDMSLTREQAATMIANLFDFCSRSLTAAAPTFSDSDQISSWAVDGVGKVAAAGIMNGMGDNKFAPQETYTREQSIVTALKTYELLISANQPSTPSDNNNSSSTVGQDFTTTFQYLYDELSYYLSELEIANATESDPPNTDLFPKIDSNLKNQYPDKKLAIGYLEAARDEMVKAVSCWIDIEIYKMMGYTQSTLASRTKAKRAEISEHISNASNYLTKANAAA